MRAARCILGPRPSVGAGASVTSAPGSTTGPPSARRSPRSRRGPAGRRERPGSRSLMPTISAQLRGPGPRRKRSSRPSRSVPVMPKTATADRVDRDALLEFLRPRHRAILLTRRRDGRRPAVAGDLRGGRRGSHRRLDVSAAGRRWPMPGATPRSRCACCPRTGTARGCRWTATAEVLDLPEALEPLVDVLPVDQRGAPGLGRVPGGDDPAGQVAAADHGHRLGTDRDRGIPARGQSTSSEPCILDESCQPCQCPTC